MSNNFESSCFKLKLRNIFDYKQVAKATSEFYNSILPEYDVIFPTHRKDQKRFAQFLHKNYLKKTGAKKIFDVACGNGALLDGLSRFHKYELHEVDASSKGIGCAKTLCGNNAVLKKQDWLGLTRTEGLFDVVLCTGNSLAHIPPMYLGAVIEKISAFTRPGGLLIVDVYSNNEWDLCEKQKIVPRSCVYRKKGYSVVFFNDCFLKKKNTKYTVKTVNIMKFNLKGLPINIKRFEVIQFVIKPAALVAAIRSTRKFLNVAHFNTSWNNRFTYFVAQRKKD